jgi:hypothetical protein
VNFFNPLEFSKRLFSGSPSSPRLTFFYAPINDQARAADPASKAEKRRSAMNLSPAIRIVLPAEFDTATAVSGISREPYRPETEVLLRSLNHGPCRADQCLKDIGRHRGKAAMNVRG